MAARERGSQLALVPVHATHVTDDELACTARSRAVVGLCPITEANLGDGVFPARRYSEADGNWGVGSDSNVLIDAAEELRLLEYGQRLLHQSRNRLSLGATASTGRALFNRAVAGGGLAAGIGHTPNTSGLTYGASADIVCLSADCVAFAARDGDALLDSLIFAGCKGGIQDIWRAGRKVVVGGRHVDQNRIHRRYIATISRLLAG